MHNINYYSNDYEEGNSLPEDDKGEESIFVCSRLIPGRTGSTK